MAALLPAILILKPIACFARPTGAQTRNRGHATSPQARSHGPDVHTENCGFVTAQLAFLNKVCHDAVYKIR
jgi:hypothetical protein